MNKKKVATLVACAVIGLSAQAQNLLLNGSFESPVIPVNSITIAIPASWQGSSSARIINGNYSVPDLLGPQDGQQYVSVGNDGTQAEISQDFSIASPGTYILTWYDTAGNAPGLTSPYSVTVFNGPTVVTNNDLVSSANAVWVPRSMQLDLTGGTYTLRFSSRQPTPGGVSVQIDNVYFQSPLVDFLYFTKRVNPDARPSIMRVKTDGTGLETVFQNATETAEAGIALDVLGGHLFSGSEAWLFRLNLDGTGRVNLVPVINPVQDVELDLVHGKIYWSEGGQGRNAIRCANFDGTDARTFIDVGTDGFFPGLAVDPYGGKLYFNYDTGGNDTIQAMDLDGSGQSVLYNLGSPGGLTYDLEIDLATDTLYFNRVGAAPGIYKGPANSSGPVEFAVSTPDGEANGLHYDPIDRKFYSTYTVSAGNEIRSVNIDGTDIRTMAQYSGVLYWCEVGHGIPVTGNDTEPPSISCPANLSVSCSTDQLAPVTYPPAIVSDNVDPAPTVTYSAPPGSGFPVGTTTVTVTATDASGNHNSCSFTVTRAPLSFAGFLSPIGGADATGGSFTDPLRTFKLKSTIPVKFTASCGGSPIIANIHTLQAIKWSNQTDSEPPIDATPTDAATTGNQFRLVGSEWHFNLDTKATGMSQGKWQLTATLSDGSQHSAWIQLK